MPANDGLQGLIIFRNGRRLEQEDAGQNPSPDYALARFKVERAAAERASSERAKAVHQELAQAYAKIACRA